MKISSLPVFIIFIIFTALIVALGWAYRHAIIFALILAGIFYPLMDLLRRKYKISEQIASLSICFTITLGIFIPFIYFVLEITQELIIFSQFLNLNQVAQMTQILEQYYNSDGVLAIRMKEGLKYLEIYTFADLQLQIIDILKGFTGAAFNFFNTLVGNLLGNTLLFLLQYIVMIVFIFALLKNGKYIKVFLNRIIPLPTKIFNTTLDRFNQMNFVTLVCNGLSGLIQGTIGGITFWLAGIETVLLWSFAMMVLAFIPLIGMSIVYIPATIYLLTTGKYFSAIFVFAGCFLTVMVTENVFKPRFIGKRVRINPLLLLFGILGGVSFFGAPGIFYGPIIVTMFLTFVQFVNEELSTR
jgi:predicted PurR-regulated permease PerM